MAGEKNENPAIDKKNRAETILLYGEVMVADKPLPDKVFERRRHTVQVAAFIHEKGKPDNIKAVATGSGYTHRPGLVVSSAHIVQELMFQYLKVAEDTKNSAPAQPADSQPQNNSFKLPGGIVTGEFHILGEDELRASKLSFTQLKQKLDAVNCDYRVVVRVFGRNTGTQVPAIVAAITNPESAVDVMILRVMDYHNLMTQSQLPVDPLEAINPAAVLVNPAATAEAQIGETVYPTGFGGFQPFVEECYVSARPKNANHFPYDGLREPYILRCSPDFGFSGGPVLNRDGQVIGISKQKTDNFLLIVSMKDIDNVLKVMDKAEKEAKEKKDKEEKK